MQYRKMPIVIEAIQWTGQNIAEVNAFMSPVAAIYVGTDNLIAIETLEGRMIANKGDWIIRGVKGELYPCKPEIFALTYEPVES